MRGYNGFWFGTGLLAGILTAGAFCAAQEGRPDKPQGNAAPGESPQAVLQRARDLNTERAAVLAELVRLLPAEAEAGPTQREEALALIGDLHMSSPSIVAALVRHLYVPRESAPGPEFVLVPPPFREKFPAFGALAKVGLPAIPALVDEIRTAEDPVQRRYAPLFLGSLLGSHAEPWLSDALRGERNEEAKARLQEALNSRTFSSVGAYGKRTWFFKRLDQAEPWYYRPPDA
ncbi:MAG: hypothetical protein ACE5JM_13945 [Armatimonadota bacterium]